MAPTRLTLPCTILVLALAGCSTGRTEPDIAALRQEVVNTERAFAKTMAERNRTAFTSFLSREAIFVSGGEVLRGADRVAEGWKTYFVGAQAPFSWEPDRVEVLPSGTLASSSGPVYGVDGRLVARFSSIWRREGPQTWRIVFDQGSAVCVAGENDHGSPRKPVSLSEAADG